MKVCITGDQKYISKTTIKKTISQLKAADSELEIITLGRTGMGLDSEVRKGALMFEDVKFGEFNIPGTPRTMYSLLPLSAFDYPFMKTSKRWQNRNIAAAKYIDYAIVFITKPSDLDDPELSHFIEKLQLYKKQYVVYNTNN